MLQIIIGCLGVILSMSTCAEIINNNNLRVIYSFDNMQEHKRVCVEKIKTNALYLNDPVYQMQRALRTIMGDDTDYIPKVVGAGEIFDDGISQYQLMHNGVKIILHSYYETQWLTDVIYALRGHHEPQEEKCFYEILKYIPNNATMIELGSYWAYYSLWFASQIDGAKNYLIEPDPQHLEAGKKNFKLNNKTGFFQQGFLGKNSEIAGVQCISIDDFIEKERIEHVNILHADIQGAECAMLETTVRHLDNIDYFFVSTHNTQISCLNFFNAHGFIIIAEHTNDESCSGDGLIVAKRKGVSGPEHIEIRKY